MDGDLNYETIKYFLWAKTWIQAFPTLIHELLLFDGSTDSTFRTKSTLSPSSSLHTYLGILAFHSLIERYKPIQPVYGSLEVDRIDAVRQFYLPTDRNLVYGEIDPESMAMIISFIWDYHMKNSALCSCFGEKIVDLGSGLGKALIAASFIYPFRQALGVEIVQSLHQGATQLFHNTLERERFYMGPMLNSTEFIYINQDLKCIDPSIISDANIILVHATMFDAQLMEHLHNLCCNCRDGSYFIMVSQGLTNVLEFQIIGQFELSMSWGRTIVFIQRKISGIQS